MDRIEQELARRIRPGQFDVIETLMVENAEGLQPGLYPSGPPGSTAAVLVYDPGEGPPRIPAGVMPPWGLVVHVEGATLSTII